MNRLKFSRTAILLFSLFLLFQSACSFSAKTTRRMLVEARKKGPYDLVIVPGTPFYEGVWEKEKKGRNMRGRVYWSKYLYDQGIAKNVMYSGSAVYTPYYEATIMALYGEALGIPKQHIFQETKAEHSTENVYYAYKKAKKMGFKRIAVASDPFQTKLLRRYVRKTVDPEIVLIPLIRDTMESLNTTKRKITIDHQQAAAPNFIPITKRESFWKRMRGTRGKNVDKRAYE